MHFISTGGTKISSAKCCILFDPQDGSIKHAHHVITVEGADETPQYLIEERTIRLASELGVDTSKTRLLHVESHNLQRNRKYKVDIVNHTLVIIE